MQNLCVLEIKCPAQQKVSWVCGKHTGSMSASVFILGVYSAVLPFKKKKKKESQMDGCFLRGLAIISCGILLKEIVFL